MYLDLIHYVGVWRPRQQVHLVSQITKSLREVVDIDTLPTTIRFSSIRQKAYSHEIALIDMLGLSVLKTLLFQVRLLLRITISVLRQVATPDTPPTGRSIA